MPTLQQLSSLEGRTALVTGGSRGLGLEIAEGLAEAGARVWITARREQWLGPALQHLREAGHAAEAVACDVGDPAAVESLLAHLRDRGVHVDVLVNNAGATWAAPPETMPLERWYQVMQVNVTGAFLLARGLAPAMRARGYGRVVNVASVAGLMGTPSHVMDAVGYSTSKAALIGLTRDLAVKWARDGITVNAIAPGFFRTRMSEALLDANEARITAATPVGRIGAEGELKGVVALLASPAGAYITGQVIAVDGGMSAM
ncbi:MAG: 3-oxoacyl-ACP reductase FabG [Vicinamibacterales bacterium]|nr:3-oxoacyl-ACP reductase FabG [Vicinamibacterales bacterium]